MAASKAKAPDGSAVTELKGNRNKRVFDVVKEIPTGLVATYGQIARLAGISGRSGARQVGYALAALDGACEIPWHRVINAQGALSPRANPDAAHYQLLLLEAEGIEFDHTKRIDLAIYQWRPTL